MKQFSVPYFVPTHDPNEAKSALERVLETGNYILNKQVSLFEKEFSKYCGVSHCAGVNSGTDALRILLSALDFPKGSEVILPSNTYLATALSVLHNGLVPVITETRLDDHLTDLSDAEKKLTKKTVALLYTHMYGNVNGRQEALMFTRKHGIHLIEDCAHAHGAWRLEAPSVGDEVYAAFSFYPTKNLGAIGDAGAVVTNDRTLVEKIKLIRNLGYYTKGYAALAGQNSRLDEIQASFLRIRLKSLNHENELRKQIAERYLTEIINPEISKPVGVSKHSWHLFVICTKRRKQLQEHLHENGIETMIHYPVPFYQQGGLKQHAPETALRYQPMHRQILSLPCRPNLSEQQVDHVIKSVNAF